MVSVVVVVVVGVVVVAPVVVAAATVLAVAKFTLVDACFGLGRKLSVRSESEE